MRINARLPQSLAFKTQPLKVQAPEGVGGGRSGAVRVKELPHKRQGDSEGVLAFVTS